MCILRSLCVYYDLYEPQPPACSLTLNNNDDKNENENDEIRFRSNIFLLLLQSELVTWLFRLKFCYHGGGNDDDSNDDNNVLYVCAVAVVANSLNSSICCRKFVLTKIVQASKWNRDQPKTREAHRTTLKSEYRPTTLEGLFCLFSICCRFVDTFVCSSLWFAIWRDFVSTANCLRLKIV